MWKDENGFFHLTPKTQSMKLLQEQKPKKQLVFRHGHIAITNYKMGDNKEFEKTLSVFDEIYWKYRPVGFYYIKQLKELRINRGYDVRTLRNFFPNHVPVVDNHAYEYDDIEIKLQVGPRDDFQRTACTFMAGEHPYEKNKKVTQILMDADTGSGKTYCGTAMTCYWSAKAIVIVPFTKLLEQWKQAFLQFSNLKEKDIMIVQGSSACKKILAGKCKSIKIFLFMVDTIASFEDQYGPMVTMDLLESTRAYLKITDEVHLDLKANAMIEALSNFRMNYYMSASPGRTARKENWIFTQLYYNVPRFGSKFKKQDEKHLNILIKNYRFLPDQQQLQSMINRRKKWLNSKAYETELIHAPKAQRADFDQSLIQILKWIKGNLKDDNKVLLLCNTIDGTEYLKSIADTVFPGETSRYYGTLPSKDEKKEALKKKVICATASSLGTGADIKGLQFCVNICTYSSKIDAVQISGRLREIPGTQVVYIELVNVGWYKTVRQYEKRKVVLLSRSRTGKLIIVD